MNSYIPSTKRYVRIYASDKYRYSANKKRYDDVEVALKDDDDDKAYARVISIFQLLWKGKWRKYVAIRWWEIAGEPKNMVGLKEYRLDKLNVIPPK